ncbi:hypothetical protein [Streptomyces sp. H27-D2]|nr:hypothetical protein [Streptomyces sp. H27-D2]MEC4018171.1 hypothetical protein [Streptomyces sp. H27-D2]
MAARTAIRTLPERRPDLTLDAHPAALIRRPGPLIRGPHALPVRSAPEAR